MGRGDDKAGIHFLAIRVNGQALNFGMSGVRHHHLCERERYSIIRNTVMRFSRTRPLISFTIALAECCQIAEVRVRVSFLTLLGLPKKVRHVATLIERSSGKVHAVDKGRSQHVNSISHWEVV